MLDRILLGLALALAFGLLAEYAVNMTFAVVIGAILFIGCLSGLLHREWTR